MDPLSPHLLFCLEKGLWAHLTKDQRGSAKAPPPQEPRLPGWASSPLSTFSSLSYMTYMTRLGSFSGPNSTLSHSHHYPQGSQNPASFRLQLPVSWLS